ncbi:methyl-accepting chemotaxis protein [Rhizobiales bacterium GAS188]|nr:methyl-accepting chemotaxis protein [Rhizobiales bacterium GAS188]
MSLTNLSLLRKLVFSFVAVLMVSVLTSAFLFVFDNNAQRAFRASQRANAVLIALNQAAAAHLDQAHTMRGFLLIHVERHAMLYGEAVNQFTETIDRARLYAKGKPDIQSAIDKVAEASLAWRREVGDPAMRLARNPATYEAAVAIAKASAASELQKGFRASLDAALKKVEASADEQDQLANHALHTIKASQLLGGVIMAVAALLAGWWLYRVIAVPVARITEAMRKLANGDRSVAVTDGARKDEIGLMARSVQVFKDAAVEKTRLEAQAETTHRQSEEARAAHEADKAEEARQLQFAADALGEGMAHLASGDLAIRLETPFQAKVDKLRLDFNRSVEKLQHTMLTIASSTKGIGSGTEEISRAADDMSRRAEQQAASLEETAAALDEITATVKKTAEGAAHAREVVANAKTDAEKSGAVVREAIKAMGGIEKSSQQIGQIIGVIDEIAFQTNLLALNASIEAARAGDAGRGFAVVASEVRALAQRSAEAAKEIKALISTSSTQVEQGVDLVGKAGQALERIAAQIAEMNTVIADIAVGAREQATGLQQVNTAINQMDQGTQQSAAMAEESTAATHSLAQESDELVHLVAQFRLGEARRAGSPAVRARPHLRIVEGD